MSPGPESLDNPQALAWNPSMGLAKTTLHHIRLTSQPLDNPDRAYQIHNTKP